VRGNHRNQWRHVDALARAAGLLLVFAAWPAARPARAQDARESLGTRERAGISAPSPLLAIEAKHPAALKPELLGVHPRVFVTSAELDQLRIRTRTTHKALWDRALANMLSMQIEPPPPPAAARRAQNDVALAMAEAAFVYKIEGDPKYLATAKKFMDAAVTYDTWGYASDKPNVDLAAGHLLYGLGWSYDLLYNDLTDAERARYRDKLVKQARLEYEYLSPKPGKSYSYSQNHLFIPAAGLAVAAYALYGEVPEAADWARLVRAIFDRVLATYSADGYYYEGFEYWVFATPWIVHYLDALAHSTGEDLYDQPGLRNAYKYVAQEMLPDGKNIFDFGDAFEGSSTRAGTDDDYARTHPGGHLHSNYILLYRFAQRFRSGAAQGVADWLASLGQTNFEDYWALVWYDPSVAPIPITAQPRLTYFRDHEVVYWRSDWTPNATAFAFKCGPPEGHRTAALIKTMADWHLEDGHAHPDAASFILYAKGKYLTGDSGYAGIPATAQHNTLLIDGRGQAHEGAGHNAFDGFSYARLNAIRILSVQPLPNGIEISADATAAYDPSFRLEKFVRTVILRGDKLTVSDEIQSASPHTFSVLIHSDSDSADATDASASAAPSTITPAGAGAVAGPFASAGLFVTVQSPKNAVTRTEPNTITAAGPPGAVDQGPKEQRGTREVISTPAPARAAHFDVILHW
jgi:hypothetical protein